MPGTSDLYDEHGERAAVCLVQFRTYGGASAFSGPISTIRCYEDNVLVKRQASTPGDGRVLVVDAGGSLRCALVGDVIAGLGVTNGWAGIVLHGCVRDVAALRELPIGIKALGAIPRPSRKLGEGEVDVPVTFGGVTFRPGAVLHADEDGIVVLDGPAPESVRSPQIAQRG
jgi:regulator of ribonuclease activity A